MSHVFGMCLSQIWYYRIDVHGSRVPNGYDEYVLCNPNCLIQISLEATEWLVYSFFWKIQIFFEITTAI